MLGDAVRQIQVNLELEHRKRFPIYAIAPHRLGSVGVREQVRFDLCCGPVGHLFGPVARPVALGRRAYFGNVPRYIRVRAGQCEER